MIKTAERFGMSPLAVLEADERLMEILDIENYAYRKEAS